MTQKVRLNLYGIFSVLFLLLCKPSVAMVIDTPTIVAGKSKITGRIIIPNDTNKDNLFVNIYVSHPISGAHVIHKSSVDQSGKFSIEIDVETDISLIGLYTSLNPMSGLLVELTNGGVTNIDISYSSDNDIKNIDVTPAMNKNNITRGLEVMNKMIDYKPDRVAKSMYDKSTDYFLNHAKTSLSERLEILNNDILISKEFKGLLSKDYI